MFGNRSSNWKIFQTLRTNIIVLIIFVSVVICLVLIGLILDWDGQLGGGLIHPSDSVSKTPEAKHSFSAAAGHLKSSQNSNERQKQKIIEDFKSSLQDLERRRIVDQCEAATETPISELLRKRLNIPASQLTRTLDIRYLILTHPSEPEKREINRRISSLATESGHVDSDLEQKLRGISSKFLNYPYKYKLVVLTKPREPSGKNNISCYNTDDVVEFDESGETQLLPGNIATSFENHDLPYQSIVRYGHLFSIRE